MIVYRFEKNGIGPYIGGVPAFNMPVRAIIRRDNLTKTQEVARRKYFKMYKRYGMNNRWYLEQSGKRRRYLFGCPSKECLRVYFGGNFKPLFKHGYRIKRYTVPDAEVINMGVEVAFPVEYHRFKSMKKLKKALMQNGR